MSVQFNVEPRESFVLITCRGAYDLGDFEEMLNQALSTASSMNLPKVLVDAIDVTGNLSTMDFFDLGEMVSRVVREQDSLGVCIAFVGNESFLDPQRFGETVAKNRGATGMVTADMEEALNFLEIGSVDLQ